MILLTIRVRNNLKKFNNIFLLVSPSEKLLCNNPNLLLHNLNSDIKCSDSTQSLIKYGKNKTTITENNIHPMNNNILPSTSNSNTLTKSKTINFNETNYTNDNKYGITNFSKFLSKFNDPSKLYSKLNINITKKITSEEKNYIIRLVYYTF